MINSLLAILYIFALVGLSFHLGTLLQLPFREKTDRPFREDFIFAVPIGMGAIGLLVWVCGLCGLLTPVLFYGLLAVGGASFVVLCLSATKGLLHIDKQFNEPKHTLIEKVLTLVVVIAGCCTLVAALAPPSALEWDALSYHLANPKMWLAHGRIDFLPFDHHSNFPFLVQMLYLLMQGAGSVAGAKLVHWLCFALLSLSVYAFCMRHIAPVKRGQTVGIVAALIFATTPIVLWESTVGYVDLATALFTWLAFYALCNAAQAATSAPLITLQTAPTAPIKAAKKISNAPQISWLILSAILMGFALGTKYTVLGFWGLLLAGIVLWHLVRRKNSHACACPDKTSCTCNGVKPAALWGAISLTIGLPWYIKNLLVTGNPVYPFAYNLFGGKYWSAPLAKQYADEQARFGYGKTALDLLLSPWRVTNELALLPAYTAATGRAFTFTEYVIFGLSPVFLALLILAPFSGSKLSRPAIYCLYFGLGIYAFWFFVMQQTRYLIPALPAFAIVSAEVLVLLFETKSVARYFAAGLVAICAAWGVYLAAGLAFVGIPLAGVTPAFPVVTGQETRESYVARTLGGICAASLWINDNTVRTEKVAIYDDTRGFYLDRDYAWAQPDHAEGLFPYDTYADVNAFLADFKKRGYTTLLLGALPRNAPPPDTKRWRDLINEAITTDKVIPIYENRGVRVYKIP